jgi:hypothetical protein
VRILVFFVRVGLRFPTPVCRTLSSSRMLSAPYAVRAYGSWVRASPACPERIEGSVLRVRVLPLLFFLCVTSANSALDPSFASFGFTFRNGRNVPKFASYFRVYNARRLEVHRGAGQTICRQAKLRADGSSAFLLTSIFGFRQWFCSPGCCCCASFTDCCDGGS